MSFISLEFGLFVAAAVPVYWALPPRARAPCLVLLSLLFYVTNSPVLALLLVATTVAVWLAARRIEATPEPGPRRGLLVGALALTAAPLLYFKYFLWIETTGRLLRLPFPPAFHTAALLPALGISYYTFKAVSYLMDIYWERMPACPSLLDLTNSIAFFPQIVSGPIQRPISFLPQLHAVSKERSPFAAAPFLYGLRRILIGVFKKVVIADNLGAWVSQVYAHPHAAPGPVLLLAVYLFTLQLYADFSGLSDIAIGLGLLVGIRSEENFDRPLFSGNIQAFWSRWHMTLTNWVADYVFTPLRMATRDLGQLGLFISLMVNMLFIGLWHGPTASFVVFGLLHGCFLSAYVLTQKRRSRFFKTRPELRRWVTPLNILVTFHCFALSLVFFRAANLSDALYTLSHLSPKFSRQSLAVFGSTQEHIVLRGLLGCVWLLLADWAPAADRFHAAWTAAPRWSRWLVYYAALYVIYRFGSDGQGHFIYGKF